MTERLLHWMDIKGRFDGSEFFHNRSKLPDRSGVYVAYSGFHALYVGQTQALRARWVTHHRAPYLLEMPAPHIAYQFRPLGLLLSTEKEWIRVLHPYLQREPRFPPWQTRQLVARRAALRYGWKRPRSEGVLLGGLDRLSQEVFSDVRLQGLLREFCAR